MSRRRSLGATKVLPSLKRTVETFGEQHILDEGVKTCFDQWIDDRQDS